MKYTDIEESEWDDDYVSLLNTVQRHSKCNSACCLRQKPDDKQSCRFYFPINKCDSTHLEFERVHTKDGTQRYKAKVVTARNDTRLNRHQRLQLQGWRANCDISIIIDYHSCIEYLTKYASKSEKISSVVRDSFVSVIKQADDHTTTSKTFKKLMMKSVGQRDMSIQEVMHQILSLQLFSSSFQVVTGSLEGSHKVRKEGDEVVTEPSLLDLYAARSQFEDQFPGIFNCNFIVFASTYYASNSALCKRSKPVVVHTFPTYTSNPKSPHYQLFCKY